MKKAAIGIDDWKLRIFEKYLTAAGFEYTVGPGVTSDTLLISVSTETISELQPIVEQANMAAAREKARLLREGENTKEP
jgi:hypothetical protein